MTEFFVAFLFIGGTVGGVHGFVHVAPETDGLRQQAAYFAGAVLDDGVNDLERALREQEIPKSPVVRL